MSAGYSGKPLVQKLGIKKGASLVFLNAPEGYDRLLGKLPDDVRAARGSKGSVDFIQLFATTKAGLEKEIPRSKTRLEQDGMLWVSWPKRSSKLPTDLSESVVRDVGLRNGLVDVKVCAVDESWSALKFVRRLKDRERNLHATSKKG